MAQHPVEPAPKLWRGRFFEDFDAGDVFQGRLGRTITEADNTWFTCLTMNTNQIHFNTEYAKLSRFGRVLVNSTFTLALVAGLTVADTSENAAANLDFDEIRLPNPVFVGDTLWAVSKVLELGSSQSRPNVGIVRIRSRGVNQDGDVIIEFKRTFMVYRRGATEAQAVFPPVRDDRSG